MARRALNRSAIQVAWTFPPTDTVSVRTLEERLADGQSSRLFDLQSWDFRNGTAFAILTPEAPLEDIVEAIWDTRNQPVAISLVQWPAGRRKRPLPAGRVPTTAAGPRWGLMKRAT